MIKIEIIIPAYNCRTTIHRALSSLGAQTDADFKVHIIDDCSKEDLRDILRQHTGLDIRLTRNEVNLGCGMTRQVGIDLSDADYIAFLDSDDVLLPYTVEMWKNAIKDSPSTDVFHSYFYEQTDSSVSKTVRDGFTWCHGKLYKLDFIRKHGIRNNSEVKYMDDAFFNSMCTELGNMSVIPIPMYMWLDNQASITRNGKMTSDACRHDFIHAMILSTEFLYSKGIQTIKHMRGTLKGLENIKHEFSDKTLEEYEELLMILK